MRGALRRGPLRYAAVYTLNERPARAGTVESGRQAVRALLLDGPAWISTTSRQHWWRASIG